MLTVKAAIRKARTGARNEPVPKHDHLQVEAVTYEDAKRLVRDRTPAGWIVASWRVDRDTSGSGP